MRPSTRNASRRRLRTILDAVKAATAAVPSTTAATGQLTATIVPRRGPDSDVVAVELPGDQPVTLLSVPADRVALWLTGDLAPDETGAWSARVVLGGTLRDTVAKHVAALAARAELVEVQPDLLGHSESFSGRWPKSGMTRSGRAYGLPTSVPAMAAPAGSALPTPTARDHKDGPETATRNLHPAHTKDLLPRALHVLMRELIDLTDPAEIRYDLTDAGRAVVEGPARG